MIQGLLPLLLVALSTSHTLRATDVGRATHRLAPRGLPQPVSTPVTPPASIVNQTAPVSANVSKSQAHVPQNYSYGSHPDNSSAIPAQVDSVNGSNSTDIAGETEDVDEASKTSVKQNVTAPGTVPSAQSPVDGNSTSKIYGSLPINAEASQVNNGTRAGDDALESDEDPSSDDDDDLAINATLANQTNASLASQHDFNPKNISDDSTTSGSAIVNATQNNVPITTTLPLDQNNTLAVNSTSDPITQSSSNSNLTSITPNGFSQNDSLSHSSSQQNSSAIPMTGAFMSTLPNPCLGLPLTTETWKNLDLDTYLHSYPNGLNTSLQEYAFSHHAQNFVCGIGEGCNAGQLCNPVTAPDWYVLYAAQEWNALHNSVYTAIGFAVSMVQATAAAMVTDLFEPEHHSMVFHLQDLFVLISGIAFTVALGALLFTDAAGLVIAATVFGALSSGTATTLMGINLMQSWDAAPDGFTRWSNYAYYLSQWQSKVQDQLSNATATTIQSGVSSEAGMYGALKGGAFLSEIQLKSTSTIEDEVKQTSTARILVDILRAQGAYVTYGSDPCDGKGTDGAWAGDDVLSFCKNGTMMNIVRASGHKTVNHWYNAVLIATKYNMTTEYLVTQSVECQNKYHGFGYDPYRNGTLPMDINSECIVNLPVCDCTDPYIKHARAKGHTTTRACREVGKLPI